MDFLFPFLYLICLLDNCIAQSLHIVCARMYGRERKEGKRKFSEAFMEILNAALRAWILAYLIMNLV